LDNLKSIWLFIIGAIGGGIANALGGFDSGTYCLIVFMALDLITGGIVAVVFKNSTKTENGAAESKIMLKGIIKKIGILIAVVVANQLDIQIGADGYLRNGTIMALIANETLSLIENTGLMGVKWPQIVIDAVEVLKKQSETKKAKS